MTGSYIWNGKVWTACHECEFGDNGMLKNCEIGQRIDDCIRLNRGCWFGRPVTDVMDRLMDESFRQRQESELKR